MLIQMLPEQVSKFWDVIKFAIEESIPPISTPHVDRTNRVLAALLSGKAQCWASYVKDGDVTRFEGVVVTRILFDDVSGSKNLFIYCIYGYNNVSSESWQLGMESLKKYAKSRNCSQIIAYTSSPYIVKLVDRLGGDTSFRFITFDLK